MSDRMSDRPTAEPAVGPDVAATAGAAAGWQPTPLPPLPPLPPGEIGWMGVPAGAWQQCAGGATYGGQAGGGWDASAAGSYAPQVGAGWDAAAAAPSYAQPAVEFLAQAQQAQQAQQQAQVGGVIFLCDPRTEDECLQRGLLGMPASQAQTARTIVPEQTLLFLFNVRTRLLFGVFRAVAWPQENIEPTAWGMDVGGGSKYPLQVRIRVEPTQGVLQLAEEHARSLLEYRGSFNRFDLRVSKAQAESLAQLFFRMGTPRAAVASDGAPSSQFTSQSTRGDHRGRNGAIETRVEIRVAQRSDFRLRPKHPSPNPNPIPNPSPNPNPSQV